MGIRVLLQSLREVNLKRPHSLLCMTHIREQGVTVMGLENSLTWWESWICCFGLHSCYPILPSALTANQISFVFIFCQ